MLPKGPEGNGTGPPGPSGGGGGEQLPALGAGSARGGRRTRRAGARDPWPGLGARLAPQPPPRASARPARSPGCTIAGCCGEGPAAPILTERGGGRTGGTGGAEQGGEVEGRGGQRGQGGLGGAAGPPRAVPRWARPEPPAGRGGTCGGRAAMAAAEVARQVRVGAGPPNRGGRAVPGGGPGAGPGAGSAGAAGRRAGYGHGGGAGSGGAGRAARTPAWACRGFRDSVRSGGGSRRVELWGPTRGELGLLGVEDVGVPPAAARPGDLGLPAARRAGGPAPPVPPGHGRTCRAAQAAALGRPGRASLTQGWGPLGTAMASLPLRGCCSPPRETLSPCSVMRERQLSGLAPCAAEELREPNAIPVSPLRFVPEGPR